MEIGLYPSLASCDIIDSLVEYNSVFATAFVVIQ